MTAVEPPLFSAEPVDEFNDDTVTVVYGPSQQRLPVVLASPHSGRLYPHAFLSASRLDSRSLRKSEDVYVDELFDFAPEIGVPLLCALFPRSFVDANREAFELDPDMFADPLPAYVNTRSPRISAGLGTVPRIVAKGEEIYRRKLVFAEAFDRIATYYKPYHDRLTHLVEQTRSQFGYCILVDCHSMPSSDPASPTLSMSGPGAQFVLGDCYGTSCRPAVTRKATRVLQDLGYSTALNAPYAGGYTTVHYGRPSRGVHALQIEIDRSLYIDEVSLQRRAHFHGLRCHLKRLVESLGRLPIGSLLE